MPTSMGHVFNGLVLNLVTIHQNFESSFCNEIIAKTESRLLLHLH